MTDHELIVKLRDSFCPTYICNDGSRTRGGCQMCHYCDGNLDCDDHYEDCLWLEIERKAAEAG